MSEDNGLIERVAHAIEFAEPTPPREGQTLGEYWGAEVRAAIAAVRAWDAEQGLVTVPRIPTNRMVSDAANDLREPHDYDTIYRAMIRAATPAPQSDGEA